MKYKRVSWQDATLQPIFTRGAAVFKAFPNLWIKGGGARGSFLTYFHQQTQPGVTWKSSPLRDLDLVLIGGPPKAKLQVAESLSKLGLDADIEHERSLAGYLGSRDLGINECLARPKELIYTEKAWRDATKQVAHPASFERNPQDAYTAYPPRVALRSLLIGLREGMDPPLAVQDSWQDASTFDLAIHLLKAFETNVEDEFFGWLEDLFPSSVRSAEQALLWATEQHPNLRLTPDQEQVIAQARQLAYRTSWESLEQRVASTWLRQGNAVGEHHADHTSGGRDRSGAGHPWPGLGYPAGAPRG